MRILVIDNYDSFVYNIAQCLGRLGAECEVARNDAVTAAEAVSGRYDAIVISPGPGAPDDPRSFGVCGEVIRAAASARVPLLGVCLGHQGIISAFGGRVVGAARVRHGKTSPVRHTGAPLFQGREKPVPRDPVPLAGRRPHCNPRLAGGDGHGRRRLGGDGRAAPRASRAGRPVPPRVDNDRGRDAHTGQLCRLRAGGRLRRWLRRRRRGRWCRLTAGVRGMLERLRAGGEPLSRAEAAAAAAWMLDGGGYAGGGGGGGECECEAAEMLRLMAGRGETAEELLGFLDEASSRVVRVDLPPPPAGQAAAGARPVDVCGTGGDGMRTANISTAAAFVAAAAGAPVAKYGNRSSSGGTGSADIFEALGCDLRAGPDAAAAAFGRLGMCFMFAQAHNPSMRNVAAARRAAACRTVFNVVGPLTNPARVRRSLVGVPSPGLLDAMPRLLAARGAELAMAVRSSDGMDELSSCAPGEACEARAPGGRDEDESGGGSGGGRAQARAPDVRRYRIDPRELGLPRADPSGLRVGSADEALRAFVAAVDGRAAPALRDTVLLNAGAAAYASGAADDLAGGLGAAREAVESGRASSLLDRFVSLCGADARLEAARGQS